MFAGNRYKFCLPSWQLNSIVLHELVKISFLGLTSYIRFHIINLENKNDIILVLISVLWFYAESGCLLPSMPSDASFDPASGISFTCDLNDNIAAPWPSSLQASSSSCNKCMLRTCSADHAFLFSCSIYIFTHLHFSGCFLKLFGRLDYKVMNLKIETFLIPL